MAITEPPFGALDAAVVRWLHGVSDRGLFITDTQLIVRRCNQWLAARTGLSDADTVGRPLFELYPTLVERGFDQYYRDALAGEIRILSERLHKCLLPITRNLHGAGLTEMAQTARVEPLWDGDTIVGTITLIEDVTERVVTDRELRNQIAASDQARKLAEHASRLKDDFLATLSHEIRTPLNAVMGWTRILRTAPSAKTRTRAMDVIERNAASQLRLVEDLLDMARILTGKMQLTTKVVDFAGIVRSAVDVIAPAASAKRIEVTCMFAADLPPVSGDADRLQQVAWNLLSNAVKFTGNGGSINVDVAGVGDRVQLLVRDNGEGVSPAFLPFVFDRFRQADASTSRRHFGLGLGLALVRQIVEMHGGSSGVESAGADQGAAFWVTLPVAVSTGAGVPQAIPVAPATLKGISVLIVDDDDDSREMLLALLTQYGARARGVSSGTAAMAELSHAGHQPDVLVSDVGMPETDGYALIRQIRALPSETLRCLPAIAVTAYANPDDRVRALVAGYQTHIAKPVDAAVLATAIADLAKPKHRTRHA